METVYFPAFSWEIHLSKTAFSIGGIQIYWYAIFITLGIIVGLFICGLRAKKYSLNWETILDISMIVIPVAILGARIYYILFNRQYYLENPWEIVNIREGGLAIYGGIIAGGIALFCYSKHKKMKLLNFLDCIAPGIAIGQAIGRWGNFYNIEAYGTSTDLPWRMGIMQQGTYQEVHPAFLYESIATFAIAIILCFVSKKQKFSGEIAYLYLILYSFIRIGIEGIRIDSLMLFDFRISQILSATIFVVFVGIFMYKRVKCRKK